MKILFLLLSLFLLISCSNMLHDFDKPFVPIEMMVSIPEKGIIIKEGALCYDFGFIRPGFKSQAVDFIIKNQGSKVIHIEDISISNKNNFSLQSLHIQDMEKDESSSFRIIFHPVTSYKKSCTVTISFDTADEDFSFKVSGHGAGSGALEYLGHFSQVDLGVSSGRTLAISPDNKFLYFSSGGTSEILLFRWHQDSETLEYMDRYSNPLINVPFHLLMSKDGKYLYVSTNGSNDGVYWFTRDIATGVLSYGGGCSTGIDEPRFLCLSPDQSKLYASNDGSVIYWFSRNPGTGSLTLINSLTAPGLYGYLGLTMSADGKHLYTGMSTAGISCLTINQADGSVSFTGSHTTDMGRLGNSVVLQTGTLVYVVDRVNDELICFRRDQNTGTLSSPVKYTDPTLNTPWYLGLSPCENHLYLLNGSNQTVTWFIRNPDTGEAECLGSFTHGDLNTPRYIVFTSDGLYVFVTGLGIGVFWFKRDR